jgi:hypothetical protein
MYDAGTGGENLRADAISVASGAISNYDYFKNTCFVCVCLKRDSCVIFYFFLTFRLLGYWVMMNSITNLHSVSNSPAHEKMTKCPLSIHLAGCSSI